MTRGAGAASLRLLLLATALGSPAAVRADATITLSARDCEPPLVAEVARLLALEQPDATVRLAARDAEPTGTTDAVDAAGRAAAANADLRASAGIGVGGRPPADMADGADHVDAFDARLRCRPAAADLRVQRAQSAAPNVEPSAAALALTVPLGRTPEAARARLIALTLSELVVSARMKQPLPAAMASDATVGTAQGDPPPGMTTAAWLAGGLSLQGAPLTTGAAVQLGARIVAGQLAGFATLRGDWATARSDQADTRLATLSTEFGPALVMTDRTLRLLLGAGIRVGYSWLRAEPRLPALAGRDLTGVLLAPLVNAAVELPLTPHLALRAAVQASYVVVGRRGVLEPTGDVVQGVPGPAALGTLGVVLD